MFVKIPDIKMWLMSQNMSELVLAVKRDLFSSLIG